MQKKKKFQYLKKIGEGAFGEVYAATSFLTNEHVAIKREDANVQPSQLQQENRVVQTISGAPGFPIFKYFGYEGTHTILATDLGGKNLRYLFEICGKRFSLKTTLMIADQLLAEIEYLHECNYIHRDIKPDNFIIGRKEKSNQIITIDFGLSKLFRDPISHSHIPFRENRPLTGTARFASIHIHFGAEQSRRDDMESLAYVLINFLIGKLPWQGIHGSTPQRRLEKIAEKKKETPPEKLCRGLPVEFVRFVQSIRDLGFDQRPAYQEYRQMFRDLFIESGYVYDYVYDWDEFTKSSPRSKETSMADIEELQPTVENQTIPIENVISHFQASSQIQIAPKINLPALNPNLMKATTQNNEDTLQSDKINKNESTPPGILEKIHSSKVLQQKIYKSRKKKNGSRPLWMQSPVFLFN